MTKYYKVADHIFTLSYEAEVRPEALAPYAPFEVEAEDSERLFEVEVVESLDIKRREDNNIELGGEIYKAQIISEDREGMVSVDVYGGDRSTLYQLRMPESNTVDATLVIYLDERRSVVEISSGEFWWSSVFHNTIIISYFNFAVARGTLLLHASTVIAGGRAFAFIAKSGTGKSTHSNLWLKRFDDALLLNDDHPVVRVFDDGKVVLYGSPWSGKRACYKNLSAPLAAVVRINRAPQNFAHRLSPAMAYASLITSVSGMQWSEELYENKAKVIEQVVTSPQLVNIRLDALPNVEAAEVCRAAADI